MRPQTQEDIKIKPFWLFGSQTKEDLNPSGYSDQIPETFGQI